MMASVAPEPNVMSLAQARCMLALLASICSMGRILRVSSLPEGSPTRVVPPPISTIGLLPVCLQPVQHHQHDHVADMERRRRAVEADVADRLPLGRQRIEAGEIRALVDEPALVERVEEVGLVVCHGRLSRRL